MKTGYEDIKQMSIRCNCDFDEKHMFAWKITIHNDFENESFGKYYIHLECPYCEDDMAVEISEETFNSLKYWGISMYYPDRNNQKLFNKKVYDEKGSINFV
jgi:hypothetical protein